jgi:hypothetical protein
MFAILLAAAVAAQTYESPAVARYCGSERRPVKTLSDPEAQKLDFQFATTVTVEKMVTLSPPSYSENRPRSSIETMAFRIRALVYGYKEESDGDLHVVLKGVWGQTMVIEFPSSECLAHSASAAQIRAARADFEKTFPHRSSKFVVVADRVLVEVVGVGFFDKVHGQRGVAPNGIELHPVLLFRKK